MAPVFRRYAVKICIACRMVAMRMRTLTYSKWKNKSCCFYLLFHATVSQTVCVCAVCRSSFTPIYSIKPSDWVCACAYNLSWFFRFVVLSIVQLYVSFVHTQKRIADSFQPHLYDKSTEFSLLIIMQQIVFIFFFGR